MSVYTSMNTNPFELLLSRPPPEFTHEHHTRHPARSTLVHKNDYVQRLNAAITKTVKSLARTQARYKHDFDKGIRRVHEIVTGDHIFLDTHDGTGKRPKLTHSIAGPFKVLGDGDNTVIIQRGDFVEFVTQDRIKLPLWQSVTEAARLGDAQPEHLAAKRTSSRSNSFRQILNSRRGTCYYGWRLQPYSRCTS